MVSMLSTANVLNTAENPFSTSALASGPTPVGTTRTPGGATSIPMETSSAGGIVLGPATSVGSSIARIGTESPTPVASPATQSQIQASASSTRSSAVGIYAGLLVGGHVGPVGIIGLCIGVGAVVAMF